MATAEGRAPRESHAVEHKGSASGATGAARSGHAHERDIRKAPKATQDGAGIDEKRKCTLRTSATRSSASADDQRERECILGP